MKIFIHLVLLFIIIFIWTTFSNAQWIRTDTVCNGSVRALTVAEPYLFASTAKGIFRSTNGGNQWTVADSSLASIDVLSIGTCGNHLFAGTYAHGVFRSDDNGTTWVPVNEGLFFSNVNTFAECKNNIFTGIYDFVNGGGAYRSTDLGSHWIAVNNGLTNNEVRALIVKDSVIYAGTRGGVFNSTNDGADWTERNIGITSKYVVTMIVHGANIFAGTIAGGAFRSKDNGLNWTAIDPPMMNKYINAFAVGDDSVIFAGTAFSGVFLSTNDGTNWTAVNTGLTPTQINALAVGTEVSGNKYLYAGTNVGVWKRRLSEMVTDVVQQNNGVPSGFILCQNYPNPFNPSTTIHYALPSFTKITLTIYDLLGREISTLVNEGQSAGWKEVVWNANNAPSGIYFYKLNAGNFSETKKLTLLK